jgi:hypothetical protein
MSHPVPTADTPDGFFAARADELMDAMPIAEKAGMMFHAMTVMAPAERSQSPDRAACRGCASW